MSKEGNDASLSASKKKRIERQKQNDSRKRKQMINRTVWICLGVIVAILFCYFIIGGLYKSITKIKPTDDYSAELAENGFIDGVSAKDYATIPDYKAMKIALSDVEYTDEEVQADIDSQLDQHKELSEDSSLEVKDGDTVSIDYVGTIAGVEFEGGNSNGEGHDLVIGSGSFIDDFEQQLIGTHPGDSVTVAVTFPEDYSNAELQGKDAEFAVDVHGIYELPEFNDEFVEEYLSENASTVEEYKQYLKDTHYDLNLTDKIKGQLLEGTEVSKYPKYLKQYKRVLRDIDERTYEQTNQFYMAYYGTGLSDFSEYTGMTDDEYEADLNERGKSGLKEILAYQAVLEAEGLSLSEQDYRDYLTKSNGDDSNYDVQVQEYGLPYLLQQQMGDKAIEAIKQYVTVE